MVFRITLFALLAWMGLICIGYGVYLGFDEGRILSGCALMAVAKYLSSK